MKQGHQRVTDGALTTGEHISKFFSLPRASATWSSPALAEAKGTPKNRTRRTLRGLGRQTNGGPSGLIVHRDDVRDPPADDRLTWPMPKEGHEASLRLRGPLRHDSRLRQREGLWPSSCR